MRLLLKIVLLLSFVSLGGCGGGGSSNGDNNSSTTIFGEVTGLTGTLELLLTVDEQQERVSVTGSSYSFTMSLIDGQSYQVAVLAHPTGQYCFLNNSVGTFNATENNRVTVECETLTSPLVTVSGEISIAANTAVDSDINDPFSPFESNSTFSQAQSIHNLSTVQGFATAELTLPGERFASSTDVNDVYQVTLQQGQQIQLQVVDYKEFENNNRFKGDLDLFLYDANQNLIGRSVSSTEFEALVVPEDGEYFIQVMAFEGGSKYVLKLTSEATISQLSDSSDVRNLIPNEAIVKFSTQTLPLAAMTSGAVVFNHQDTKRAMLAQFRDTQTFMFSASSQLDFMGELAQNNPESYEKLNTLLQIKAMQRRDDVEYAEPNYWRKTLAVPNDDFYNLQWHYPAMNLPQAWDITTGKPPSGNVIVAVVDTGVVLNHTDLAGQLVPGYDFISQLANAADGDGIDSNPDDPGDGDSGRRSSWHGTHVSGTVAARTNNSLGGAGVSWEAKVMPLRALGPQGGSSYDIMQAVRYAAGLSNDSGTVPSQTADIINLSLGGPEFSPVEAALYQAVYDQGIILVAAAGNEDTSRLTYPASYNGVISVSATDALGRKAPYSNFGTAVDISAPGGNVSVDETSDGQPDGVLSTSIDDSSGSRQPVLAYLHGTSMASPHVAGMFALMKAVYPALTAANAQALLQAGSLTNDVGPAGRDNTHGYGAADALKAVKAALELAGGDAPDIPPTMVASPSSLALGSGDLATVSILNQGGGNPRLTQIAVEASWLTVTSSQTDGNGLGDYLFTVDRSGLGDGVYVSTVTFSFDSASQLAVQVSMTVGQVDTEGEVSRVYVILFDPTRQYSISQALAETRFNGDLVYSLRNVPDGEYQIYAGTDMDNDGFICQAGEACGTYPSLGELVTVPVSGQALSNVDFPVDIVAGFGNISTTSASSEVRQVKPIAIPSSPVFHANSGKSIVLDGKKD